MEWIGIGIMIAIGFAIAPYVIGFTVLAIAGILTLLFGNK